MKFQWRKVWAFARKDLQESLVNRAILISVLLPIAASLLFTALDAAQVPQEFALAVFEEEPGFSRFVSEHIMNFSAEPVESVTDGQQMVTRGEVDALVVVTGPTDYLVFLDAAKPVKFYALMQNTRLLVELYVDVDPGYFLEFVPLQEADVSQSLLPIWMTITMTMIGVMVVSGIVAEEKDTKTLDAVLTAPMNRWEILWGKTLFGVLLCVATVVLMAALNGVLFRGPAVGLPLLVIVVLSSICFTALGVCIGIAAESQSAARSIGTIVYLPLLFPTLIYDLSPFTQRLAAVVPTFYAYRGMEKLLYYGLGWREIALDLAVIAGFTLLFAGLSYYWFKKVMFHAKR